jgi:methionyl-tRNA formyltransferase
MRPTEGFDEGPVCATVHEPIRADDDYGALAARLEARGAQLLLDVLREQPPFVEQPADGVLYAEKIGPADRLLDPLALGAPALERTVRALHPHIGARLALGDDRVLGVRRARALEADGEAVAPGTLTAADGRLLLATADGTLELLEVQPPGGRPMDAAAYVRGYARD